jgi:hypothetical protein
MVMAEVIIAHASIRTSSSLSQDMTNLSIDLRYDLAFRSISSIFSTAIVLVLLVVL